MRNAILATLLLIGCSSDDPPPTCQQAFTHYYDAGCGYTDLATGQPIPVNEMIGTCLQAIAAAPSSCDLAMDAWLSCHGGVDDPSTTDTQCDCSAEQQLLLTCD